MSETSIRPAQVGDAEAIAEVGLRGWQEGFRGLVPEHVDPRLAWNRERVAARLAESPAEGGETRVAERDGGVRGFTIFGPSRDGDRGDGVGEIWVLFVHPSHWRQGVGRALVNRALTGLRERGFREATVWTLAESAGNVAFYEALSFRLDGAQQRREEFGNPLEARLRTDLGSLGCPGP